MDGFYPAGDGKNPENLPRLQAVNPDEDGSGQSHGRPDHREMAGKRHQSCSPHHSVNPFPPLFQEEHVRRFNEKNQASRCIYNEQQICGEHGKWKVKEPGRERFAP
ncbi:hypothetical protein D1872_254960 [compost metagenome]